MNRLDPALKVARDPFKPKRRYGIWRERSKYDVSYVVAQTGPRGGHPEIINVHPTKALAERHLKLLTWEKP